MRKSAHFSSYFPQPFPVFFSEQVVFGKTCVINQDVPIGGRHLLGIVKKLDVSAWVHLFREKGAEFAREKGNTLNAIYSIRDTLEL
jgi:hypothetical protein